MNISLVVKEKTVMDTEPFKVMSRHQTVMKTFSQTKIKENR